MNAPILDLLKRIEVARDCDDESREESSLDLIAVMKQLGKLLKDTGTHTRPLQLYPPPHALTTLAVCVQPV
jgi:hypothetical protein